jgi:flagellum-specific peptidoglycan hydrolase FlgJ
MTGKEKTERFIDTYGTGIANLIRNTGIFFPGLVAKICLESTYGASKITTEGFNFGGVKYNPNIHSDYQLADTTEYVNGRRIVVKNAKFAKFRSVEDGLAKQVSVLMLDRYKNGRINAKTPEEQLTMWVNAGYSTTPANVYVSNLRSIIKHSMNYKPIGRIGAITR